MSSMPTFELNDDDMPAPGGDRRVDPGGGVVALVENTNGPVESTVTHAAAVRQREQCTRVERYTLGRARTRDGCSGESVTCL